MVLESLENARRRTWKVMENQL